MMSESAVPRIRPMRVSDIMDAGFRLYRQNFILFTGIVALVQIPLLFIQLIVSSLLPSSPNLAGLPQIDPSGTTAAFMNIFSTLSNSSPIVSVITLLGHQIAMGALAKAIAHRYLQQEASIFGSYQLGFGRIASLLGVSVLLGLIAAVLIGIPSIVLVVIYTAVMIGSIVGGTSSRLSPGSTAVPDTSAALSGIYCLLGVVIVLILLISMFMLRFIFTTQTVVLEKQNPFDAIRRSWALSKGTFWRILGISIMIALIIQVISLVPLGLAVAAVSPIAGNADSQWIVRIVINTVQSLVQIMALPIQLGVPTLLYFDQRVRKEAFDLNLLVQDEATPSLTDAVV